MPEVRLDLSNTMNMTLVDRFLHYVSFDTQSDDLTNMTPSTPGQMVFAQALEKELRKTERKLAKLFDAWEDEDITDNEFVQRKAVHNERIEAIKRQMDELEESIPEKEEYQEKIMYLSDALNSLLDETLDAEIKNTYLKQIIERIEFSRENSDEFILDVFLK